MKTNLNVIAKFLGLAIFATTPAWAQDSPAEAPAEQPAQTAEQPAQTAEQPAQTAEQPAQTAEQPAQTAEQPAQTAEQPAQAAEQPTAAPKDTAQFADDLPNPADVTPAQAAQILADQLRPASERANVSRQKELQFNFTGASWENVLQWFSDEADLSLQYDKAPTGTVTFRDPSQTYTPEAALDLLNRLLLDRGYALIRRGRMLLLVDLEVENVKQMISEIAELVTPAQLDSRGRSDIVNCVFSLGAMTPEDAKRILPEMVGPAGRVIVLDSARQVKVTETADKLMAIRTVLEASKTPVEEIVLKSRSADEVLEAARPLLGLEPGENTSEEIRISVGLYGDRIYATGLAAKVDVLQALVAKLDKPLDLGDAADTTEPAKPVFKMHKVSSADIASVFEVLQTMLQGQPDTNIAIEPSTKSIIARTRPDVQKLIADTIAQMDGKGKQLKVLVLRRLDPSQALLTINKYFGITEEGGDGPIVDGDPVTGKLWIRGTEDEIAQVEKLVAELEGDDALAELSGKVRILPFTGRAAEDALNQVESIWQVTGRSNQIRTIAPSARSGESASGIQERKPKSETPQPLKGTSEARNKPASNYRLVAQVAAESDVKATEQTVAAKKDDIVVQVTPAGIIIASDDIQALDAFQALLESVATPSAAQSDLPVIFWLKFSKADETAELIASVLGGSESTLSSVTDSLVGGLGGGMLGGLMGLGGGGGGGGDSSSKSILTSTGSINIVADARLNALFVQANPIDLQVVEMILEKVDVPESEIDVEIVPKPMLIPVIYHSAKDIAEVVKSVFGDRIAGAQSGGGNRGGGGGQPSPQEFLQALRGGGRGQGGGNTPKSETPKIAISVDERSNSLVVIATPQDFKEVQSLVIELDEGGKAVEEIVQVVDLPGTMNAQAMVEALEALLGTKVTTAGESSSGGQTAGARPGAPATTQSPEDIRARIEAFRARFGGGGGPGGGAPGGRGGPGGFGGGRGGAPGGGGGRPGGGGGGPGGRGR